jgi:hypothetical protein
VTERAAGRRRVILYSVPLVLLFAASVVFEVTASPSNKPLARGLPCLLPSRSSLLQIRGTELPTFLSDGDTSAQLRHPTLWYVVATRDAVIAHRLRIAAQQSRLASFPVRLPGSERATAYDVATWAGRRPALFAIRQERRAIVVTIFSLDPRSRVLGRGKAPEPRPGSGVRRGYFVARLTGRDLDLFVIDRHRKNKAATLSVYSGESHFARALIDNRTIPLHGMTSPSWSLDVARTDGRKPAIVALRSARGSLFGRPEAHVLTGDSDFRTLTLDTRLSRAPARSRPLLVASSRAGSSVYAFRRPRPGLVEVRTTPLGVPRSSQSC